jgi:hypothetical protein
LPAASRVSSFRFQVRWDEGVRGFGVKRVQRFKVVQSSKLFKDVRYSMFDVRCSIFKLFKSFGFEGFEEFRV